MTDTALSILQRKVRQIEIVSNRLVTDQMAGEYHSVFKGQGMEFEEVRPYTPGDEIRSIDWNVTARAGEPHVKRYREERELTVFFVVDASASCRFGTRGEFKSERMAEICCVLAFAGVANHDRAGLLLCSDRVELVVPAAKGRRHTLRLVREVLGFKPEGRGTNLGLGLSHLRRVLHRKAVIFLVSDFLDLGFEPELSAAARRHDVVALAVNDPLEGAMPAEGLIDFVDPETGEFATADASDPRFQAEYGPGWTRRREALRKLFAKHEVDLLEIRSDRPYERDLVRFFRRRALRSRR